MLFTYKNQVLTENKKISFINEKELQTFFEQNMQVLIGYKFLKSEFTVGSYRLDSVAYDDEAKAFVIVEYKNCKNDSLVDQGYAYLQRLLDRQADFVFLYNEVTGESRNKQYFDWSQSKIVFVSPTYTAKQIDATAYVGAKIELYEAKKYENDLIIVNKISKDSSAKSKTATKSVVSSQAQSVADSVDQVMVTYDEDYHFAKSKSSDAVKDLYFTIKEKILELDDELNVVYTKGYITFKNARKRNVIDLWLQKSAIEVVLCAKRDTIKDPFGLTYDIANRLWSNSHYALKYTETSDIEEIMMLVRQVYNNSKK